ncbi:MAG: WcaI family glycosyltransferase, partial [Syntrophorhabdaceae bacterium]|nr:WcaI family glycosyltransferase [Syntrophorhabdaceae bacterium]
MRILIYGMNYAPELIGIGKYTSEMAEWLAARGHAVRVMSAPPHYPAWKIGDGYHGCKYVKETIRGVEIFRCPVWVPKRPEGISRLFHPLSFALSSFPVALAQIFWRPDVVFAVEPTLFCAPGALAAARLSGAEAWLHVQDYEVEAFFGLGYLKSGFLKKWIVAVEGWLTRRFDIVSSVSRRMVARLSELGLADSRAALFPNWVDTEQIKPGIRGRDFREEWGLAPDARIVLYAGNMGLKQGLEVILETAAAMREEYPSALFLMVGDGPARDGLVEKTKKLGLRNVVFKPLQPPEDVPSLLATADVHLVIQKKGGADAFLPSKLTGILAVGGAALVTADAHTELGRLVTEYPGIFILVPPEDPASLKEALLSA